MRDVNGDPLFEAGDRGMSGRGAHPCDSASRAVSRWRLWGGLAALIGVALCGGFPQAAAAGGAQRANKPVARSSLCRHVRARQVSAAVGFKIQFVDSDKVVSPKGTLVVCDYQHTSEIGGPASGIIDTVALDFVTLPKPLGASVGALEKFVGSGKGPDRTKVYGVYRGLGVPACVIGVHAVAGATRVTGIAAGHGTHVWYAYAVEASDKGNGSLPIPILAKLVRLAFRL